MDNFDSKERLEYTEKIYKYFNKKELGGPYSALRLVGQESLSSYFTINLADESMVLHLINLAIEQKVLFVNELTFYVADISEEHHIYNSLLFQSDGVIFKNTKGLCLKNGKHPFAIL